MTPLQSLPPLLRLPVELHREIIDYLELQDCALLTLTSRYFATVIRPPSFQEFLAAETGSWAISKDLYACKGCERFQHLLQFADEMRKGKRGRHGVDAQARFCVKCGVDQRWYSPGTELTIMGKPCVVCSMCGVFTDCVGKKGACASCQPNRRAVRKQSTHSGTDDRHYESEDDCADSTESHTKGNHSEEMYGLWLEV